MALAETIQKHTEKFWHLSGSPTVVAGGVAIGIFLGFTPLYGLKTALALGLAWMFRCNGMAAVMAVTLHDLLLPILPFLLRVEYDIGYWLLVPPHHFPPRLEMHHVAVHEMLQWHRVLDTTLPLLIGAAIIGLPVAAAAFFLTRTVFERRNARRSAL
jgi:uncharacterized protein (DUF2062 family)